MSKSLFAFLVLVALCPLAAAQGPPVFGTEIFIVADWSNTPSGQCNWDNIVLLDSIGTQYTIQFNVLPTSPNGIYGTMAVDGPYILEALWINGTTSLPLGITSGHHHIQTTGGNPGNFERTHWNGTAPTQYQGYTIRRTDGQPFQMLSIDYQSNAAPLRIGSYVAPATYADYNEVLNLWVPYGAAEGFIINDPTWRTHNFGSLVSDDLAVGMITSPAPPPNDCDFLTATESVTVDLVNFGQNTIPAGTVIAVTYTIDGGMTNFNEALTLTNPLAPFASISHTFGTTVDLSVPGVYTIDVTALYSGDLDPTNDTNSMTIGSGGLVRVNTFPFAENFDGFTTMNGGSVPPVGWRQDPNDGGGTGEADWFFRNDAPPSNNGPNADHTTGVTGQGYFAYVEDNGNQPAVNLLSPCLEFSSIPNPTLRFYVHSNNSQATPTSFENFLHVDALVYPGPTVMTDLIPPIGHLGNQWTLQIVDLSVFLGQTVQIRFRGRSDGGSSTHDIAIDDFEVFDAMPSNGQAPQFGLAAMDISDSANGAGFPVSFGNNGPYFTSVAPGDAFEIMFEGQVDQPVILMFAPLNVAAASFPNVGQIDIGGPLDPMSGFPTGIGVLGNGTVPNGINIFFNTGPTGTSTLSFTTPNLPTGVLTTFQAVILNNGPNLLALSNAVEVTII